MRYYSCDSHVVEPPEVFAGLEGRFGSRAPQIVIGHQGRPGEFVLLPGSPPIPVGRLGIAGNRLDDPATQERITRGYAGLNPGVLDPHRRLDEQTQDGIVGEVMYPSINLFTFAIPDRDVVAAVFERHNDWVLEYCSAAPHRLIGHRLPAPARRRGVAGGAAAGRRPGACGASPSRPTSRRSGPTATPTSTRSGRPRRTWACPSRCTCSPAPRGTAASPPTGACRPGRSRATRSCTPAPRTAPSTSSAAGSSSASPASASCCRSSRSAGWRTSCSASTTPPTARRPMRPTT